MNERLFTYRYELFLALLTLGMLTVMEISHPYFFLQDDNRTYHLPYHLHNLRALLGGELPLFNFNQYLGTPVSFLSAPFYPVNYLALLLSRLLLGHYFGAMEFVALFHLVIGVLGFFRFARGLSLDEASCAFGAIAWGFSPFVITLGNSWIHTLGYAAWLPWILHYSLRQLDGFRARTFLPLIGVRLLAFLLGYPQWFLYTATFDLLLVGACHYLRQSDASSADQHGAISFMLRYAGSYLAFLALALPFLLQLLHESSLSFLRKGVLPWDLYAMYPYGLKAWLHGLFVPFLSGSYPHFGELHFVSHIGYLTLIFVVAAIFFRGTPLQNRQVTVVALLALLAFLWSADTIVTRVVYYLPVFGRMRYPFKLQMFTGFFLVTLATFGCSAFFARIRRMRSALAVQALVILLHTVNFLALYSLLPQRMLSSHLDTPPFVEPLAKQLAAGRIVSAGPDVVWDGERVAPGNTVPTLGYNFAMLWDLYHFGGYEAMLSEKNLHAALDLKNNSIFTVAPGTVLNFSADVPLDYLRKWGVSWYVVNRQIPLAGTEGLTIVHQDRFRSVLHDPAARPLAFWNDTPPAEGVKFTFRSNAVEIETSRPSAGELVVNVLHNDYFRGYLDGREVGIVETADGQMSLPVPSGEHRVVLRYVDRNLQTGGALTSVLLTVLLICWLLKSKARSGKGAANTLIPGGDV